MINIIKQLALVMLLAMMSACATMFNSGPQRVDISASDNQRVNVVITEPDRKYNTSLPVTVFVRPSTFSPFVIDVNDVCYEVVHYQVGKSLDESYFINLLNIHGLYIDALTGYMWSYDPIVNLPVNKKISDECQNRISENNVSVTGLLLPPDVTPQPPAHYFGAGFFSQINIAVQDNHQPDTLDSFGLALSYEFILNSLLHVTASYSSINDNQYYSDNTLDYTTYSSGHLNTTQETYTLGFRLFPTEGKNWFLGGGVGFVSIYQDYSRFTSNKSISTTEEAYNSVNMTPIYLDLGWQKRFRRGLFTINALIDFERFGLVKNDYRKENLNFTKISDQNDRINVIDMFERASNSSRVTVLFSYGF